MLQIFVFKEKFKYSHKAITSRFGLGKTFEEISTDPHETEVYVFNRDTGYLPNFHCYWRQKAEDLCLTKKMKYEEEKMGRIEGKTHFSSRSIISKYLRPSLDFFYLSLSLWMLLRINITEVMYRSIECIIY